MKKYNVFFFGARDYYEVALALKEKNLLNYLITDFYCPNFLRKILKKRYCENIASNKVVSIYPFAILNFFFIHTRFQKFLDFTFGFLAGIITYFSTNRAIVYSYYISGFVTFYKLFKIRPDKFICFQDHPTNWFVNNIMKKDKINFFKKYNIYLSKYSESFYTHKDNIRYREALLKSDLIICSSSITSKSLEFEKSHSLNIKVIPYGSRFKNYKNRMENIKNINKINLITIGQLNQRKGLHWAFMAMKSLKKSDQNKFEWIVVSNFYDKIIQGITPHNVKYYSELKKEHLINLIKKSDLFVLPSLIEGFGHVYLETMSLGTPSLYSENTGANDFASDGFNSIKVKAGSVRDLKIVFKNIANKAINLKKMKKNCKLPTHVINCTTFRKELFRSVNKLENKFNSCNTKAVL